MVSDSVKVLYVLETSSLNIKGCGGMTNHMLPARILEWLTRKQSLFP